MKVREGQAALDGVEMDDVDHIIDQWKLADSGVDASPLHVFGRIHRLYIHYNRAISGTFAEAGINSAGFDVLATLRRAGNDSVLTPTQLAASGLVTTGGMSLRLNRLEDAGLIERTRIGEDRRAVLVQLTPKGKELISDVARIHFDREREMMSALSEAEAEQLAGLLRRLGRSVHGYQRETADSA